MRWTSLGPVCLIVVAPTTAVAQTTAAPDRVGDEPREVVITVPRRPPGGADVVHREAIDLFGPASVADALERLPSVGSGGGRRNERILVFRGFDQRQVLTLLDGVPIVIPFDGQLDLGKIPTDLVDHIHLVGGAGSLLYGPNGLGGAINIVTIAPRASGLRTWLESDPGRVLRGSITGTVADETAGLIIGVQTQRVLFTRLPPSYEPTYYEDGGRRRNSDIATTSLYTKGVVSVFPDHQFEVTALKLEGEYGVPPSTRELVPRFWRWSDWQLTSLSGAHVFRRRHARIEERVFVNTFGNTLDSYDDLSFTTQNSERAWHSVYDDVAVGAFVRTDHTFVLGEAESALAIRSWSGVRREQHRGVADRGADSVEAHSTLWTISGQAELHPWCPLWVDVGLQVDGEVPGHTVSDQPSGATALGPLASASIALDERTSLRVGVTRRTRFPTLRERFSTAFGGREANPTLRPESAWNASLDLVYSPSKTLVLEGTAYHSWVEDLILEVFTGPGVTRLENTGSAVLRGAEIEAKVRPASAVEITGAAGVLDARRTDVAIGETDRIAYRPSWQGLLVLTVQPIAALEVSLIGRAVGAQDYQDANTREWQESDPFALVDGRVTYRPHSHLRTYVRVTNALNSLVEPRWSFPEPAREVLFGLESTLGGGSGSGGAP